MGLTWTEPEEARKHVEQVKAGTKNPFQVNFALAFEPKALDAALEAGAPVVTFSWGDPAPHIEKVRNAKALLGIQVTNAEETQAALKHHPDFLICQGTEAGGHVQANKSLWETLPDVLQEAGETPVVAAGGIADGAGISRAMKNGAQGAMLGTRFVATHESRAHTVYKRKLIQDEDTTLTLCFDGGWPDAKHRVLRNSTLQTWERAGEPKENRPGENEIVAYSTSGEKIERYEDTAPREGMSGDIEAMCLYAGEGCRLIRDLPRAGELVERLWRESQKR